MKFCDVLKSERIKLDLTQAELAKCLDVSPSTVGMWEQGKRTPSYVKLEEIADFFNIEINKLHGREETQIKNLVPITLKHIPVLGNIACGEPIFAEQSEGVYVDTDSDSDADFALICRGDSMIGDDIRDGDYVMIRRQPSVDNGEIACVLIGDEATLKHFYFNNGVVTLTAANQKYPPMVFSGHDIDEIRILGKAVGLTRFF